MTKLGKDLFLNLIPIGKIIKIFYEKNIILVKNFGDILEDLTPPFYAFILEEQPKKQKINEIIRIQKNHSKNLLKILEIFQRHKHYELFYETYEPLHIFGNLLFCIEENLLENTKQFYYYHLKDKKVFDTKNEWIGRVKDYLESSAHGILNIQLEKPPYKEILVPFIDKYCKIEYTHVNSLKKIDKIIVYHWEYFLET